MLFAQSFPVGLYERWMTPTPVLLAVIAGIPGAYVGICMAELSFDPDAQIALLLLSAFAANNGILIVEFANEHRKVGMPIALSAVLASQMRFAAMIMTSVAFIAWLVPLVWATGAAQLSRRGVGTHMSAEMIIASSIGIFLIPMFCMTFQPLREWAKTLFRGI